MQFGLISGTARLRVGAGEIQGTPIGGVGTARSISINRATQQLVWHDAGGTRYAAQGMVGSVTGRSDGSLWVSSSGDLLFALGGLSYTVRPRPYEPVSASTSLTLDDGNIFGGSTQSATFGYTVPAGKRLLLTELYVGMQRYTYAGGPSYSWTLRGTGIGRSDFAQYRSYGTVTAPIATFEAGSTPTVDFSFNNFTSEGLVISFQAVLTDA